jgi:glycopeptide antibiotics resistance protein
MLNPMRRGAIFRVLPMAVALALMTGLYLTATIPADPGSPTALQTATSWMSWSLLNNILHVPAYFLLAWVLFFCVSGNGGARRATGIAIGVAVAYGALLELAQSGVPGRYASLGDVALNTLGAAAGAMLAARCAARRS